MRNNRRGPGHRSNTLPYIATPQLALEVISIANAGGFTTIRLGLLSAVAHVIESTTPAVVNPVILLSWQTDPLDPGQQAWQTTALQEVADGGTYAEGRYADLIFGGNTSPILPWELWIPTTWQQFGTAVGGKLAGTFSAAQGGAGTQPPYVRVSNLAQMATPFPDLMYPVDAQVNDATHITLQYNTTGVSPFVFIGIPGFVDSMGGGVVSVVDAGNGLITLEFGGGCVAGSTLSLLPAWAINVRGSAGQWSTPFSMLTRP